MTPQVQQSVGHLMVEQGSVSQLEVVETQVCPGGALDGQAAIRLAGDGGRIAELTRRAEHVRARIGHAVAGHAALADGALGGVAEIDAGAVRAVLSSAAGDALARIGPAETADAELSGRQPVS